ncbi:TRAP-type C4-dicarboxylate transport system, substrate-binding protein [Palleronia marisminoris]|uniref:Lactate-binding periplasmic protein n=1 Tax=Palleronia marisminoris TaxID=315423 RepID=A0A1Y5TKB5_9RHOB|nr:TRAP transporter substrate-binding protein DctP [Palleronia marisminoris]SFH41421.1 TRAP-type C4-dicarboxylate transport system, substrate-binding protein [Palleronia marisminoris]SLN66074.1 Lactate-binding periplasmic protein precursor [Palleronia marisminoris]
MKTILTTTATAMVLALAATHGAEARDLRAASGAPPAHPSHSHMYGMLDEVLTEESGGALGAQLFGPEVVSLPQMKDALQSDLVEIGNMLPLYFPAELPNMALAGELALQGRDPQVMAAAMTDYMVTCEACQEELSEFGVAYLGSGSSDVYALLTNKPVRTQEDLAGMRLRSGGAPFSRWAENFGAVPASIAVGDTFESMSQGVIDGSIASVADLLSFRLIELADAVTLIPLGTYHATSDFTVSDTAWDSLSVEERTALARAANKLNAVFTHRWSAEMPQEARAAAEEAGIEFIEPDPAFLEASNAFAEADAATAATFSTEEFGLENAAERVARFEELITKWEGLLEGVETPEEIAAIVQTEVWDNVDFATYGQ